MLLWEQADRLAVFHELVRGLNRGDPAFELLIRFEQRPAIDNPTVHHVELMCELVQQA